VPTDEGWATLRQAEAVSGVAASTIRNWARKGKVASRLDHRVDGPRRMVQLGDVVRRASNLDEPPPPPRVAATAPNVPDGQMLVPLDAWERMLIQLGNLHEAGQQLADARERAAKAETESSFLRERLAEIRAERDLLKERVGGPDRPGERTATREPLWRRVIGELWQRPKW
jgi:hypothetical protein